MPEILEEFLSQHGPSVETYGHVLREAQALTGKPVESLAHEDVIAYFSQLGSQAPNTIRKKMAVLGSFFRYLRDRQIRADSPMWGLTRTKAQPRATVRYLEVEEQVALINGCRQPRSKVILWVLLHGLRRSEVVSLNVESMEGTVLRVTGKGAKVRWVPLEPSAMVALRTYLRGRSWGPLLLNYRGQRLSDQTVENVVHEETLRTLGKRMNPHSLRHSAATRWDQHGLGITQIQELLGHSSLQVTDTYIHLSPRSLVEAIEAHPLIAESDHRGLTLIQGGIS